MGPRAPCSRARSGVSGPVPRSRSRNEEVPITSSASAATCFSSGPISARTGPGLSRGNARYSAGDDDAAAEAAAAQPADHAHHPFLVQGEAGGGDREAGRVGQPHRDLEVVGDPLELGVHDADQGRLPGDLAAGDRLERVAVGEGVRDGGDALGPLGEQDAVGDGQRRRTGRRCRGACRRSACSGAVSPRPGSRPGTPSTRRPRSGPARAGW